MKDMIRYMYIYAFVHIHKYIRRAGMDERHIHIFTHMYTYIYIYICTNIHSRGKPYWAHTASKTVVWNLPDGLSNKQIMKGNIH